MSKRFICLILAAAAATGSWSSRAWAWGATGHRLIGQVAAAALPVDLPGFLRTPQAIFEIGELSREPDRWRRSGLVHDKECDPAHYINVDDALKIKGAISLAGLPATREDYDTKLRSLNSTQYQSGYLPYAIIDGWQQLKMDLAYWRADLAGEKSAKSEQLRAWFAADRNLREQVTIRDLGVWAHFVEDGSQPMHVSVHHDGWGDYPNPEGFTTKPGLHGKFEGTFVRANVQGEDVSGVLAPLRHCSCNIEAETETYLSDANRAVIPLYRLEKQDAFDGKNLIGKEFVVKQLAIGAAELRNLIVEAWRQSATGNVGYPAITIRQIEGGRVDTAGSLQGLD